MMRSILDIGSPGFLYMMEQEGLLNTRESSINAAIKEFKRYLKQGYNINDPAIQEKVFNKCNLHNLTEKESNRIAKAVRR